jgi:SRSO17 transposase
LEVAVLEYRYGKTPMVGELGDFAEPVRLHLVDETKLEAFWDSVVRENHYLGFESVIGSRLKYLITLGTRVVGAISFCSAAYKLGPRDAFVGWDEPARLAMLPGLVCNNRFLIFPWVRIKNLASHVLSLSLRRLRLDWEERHGVEPIMVETFVDRERFLGTCYAADNWIRLGETKGFGRRGNGFEFHGNVKSIFVKMLSKRFARAFRPSLGRLPDERKELLSMINSVPLYWPGILDDLGVAKIEPEALSIKLRDHLERYIPYLTREELKKHMVNMVKGLLSDLERKSVEPICLAFAGPGEHRNMTNFMTRSPWDDQGMLAEYQKEIGGLLSDPAGMITGDGCDFPKKGSMSAGVARQHCGPLGKVDNCQAGVMVGCAGPRGCGLADFGLFMPEKWFGDDYAERRGKCRVPKELEFKTKNAMLSEMIGKLHRSGCFKGKYVGVDAGFGRDHSFLDSLPPELIYFADVPSDCRLFKERPEVAVPEYRGRGRRPTEPVPAFPARAVKDVIADESEPWNDVVLGMGSKGPVVARDKCVKVVESRDGKPGKDVWLYARMLEDGKMKYSLCNESMDAALADVRAPALMRWSIEQCFRECKDHLGMDHYEVRTWHGWRRHMLLTLIAHLFVIKLRLSFGVMASAPGPAPVVDKPVCAQE